MRIGGWRGTDSLRSATDVGSATSVPPMPPAVESGAVIGPGVHWSSVYHAVGVGLLGGRRWARRGSAWLGEDAEPRHSSGVTRLDGAPRGHRTPVPDPGGRPPSPPQAAGPLLGVAAIDWLHALATSLSIATGSLQR